jgi:hypothetical protein
MRVLTGRTHLFQQKSALTFDRYGFQNQMSKGHIATLDDKFVPTSLFPTGSNQGRVLLLMAFIVGTIIIRKVGSYLFANHDGDAPNRFNIFSSIKSFFRKLFHNEENSEAPAPVKEQSSRVISNRRIASPATAATIPTKPIRQALPTSLPNAYIPPVSVPSTPISSSSSSTISLWKSCKLERKEILNDRFMLYRFYLNDANTKPSFTRKVSRYVHFNF